MSAKTKTTAGDGGTKASAPAASKAKPRAHLRHFGLAEYKFNRWSCVLEPGQTIEDALDPSYWTDAAPQILGHDKQNPRGRGDIIEIREISTGLYAELMITEIGPGFVKTKPIRHHVADKVELPEGCPFKIDWNASRRAHDVVRVTDGHVMRGGFQSQEGAAAWIFDHMKAMAA